jgi:hypothetical protein
MKTSFLILLCSGLLFSGLLLAQTARGEDIQPGSWNVDMTMTMASEAPVPIKTATICLQNVKQLVKEGAECAVNTTSSSGSHTSMDISCNVNGLQMTGTASLTVSRTIVDGTLNLAMQMGNDPSVQTVTTMHAVRAGDCQNSQGQNSPGQK